MATAERGAGDGPGVDRAQPHERRCVICGRLFRIEEDEAVDEELFRGGAADRAYVFICPSCTDELRAEAQREAKQRRRDA